MAAIEVFKTNLLAEKDARLFHTAIQEAFPQYRVNFDLADCDRIMRIVSPPGMIDISALTRLAVDMNVSITPLPDEVPG